MSRPLHILIAGAGIGGLSAALACARAGHRVSVFERTRNFQPVGAGLQLSANALSVLKMLNVSGLREAGLTINHVAVRDGGSGRTIAQIPTPSQIKTIAIARADLQHALLLAVRSQSNISIELGRAVISAESNDEAVRLIFENGSEKSGDLAIGADGVWSKLRSGVNESKTKYTGRVAWRATLPMADVPVNIDRRTVSLWLSPGSHLLTYPIAGATQMNIVAIQKAKWTDIGWSVPGARYELQDSFVDWTPKIQTLIERPEKWLKWALCCVDPNSDWVRGRVGLLGDAAHAMPPFMAQGAATSIEDASVLASHLKFADPYEVPEKLIDYQTERKDRVAKVWNLSFQQGEIYHMNGPLRHARDIIMRMAGPLLASRYDWIYNWRPDQSN